ncbi:hypothetical protein [Methanorbis rubei]
MNELPVMIFGATAETCFWAGFCYGVLCFLSFGIIGIIVQKLIRLRRSAE